MRATDQHLDVVMSLVRACVARMQAQGIDQWDTIYPDRATFARDIADGTLWMAVGKETCQGIAVINEYQDAAYTTIDWLYQGAKILVVHRLAVTPESQGRGIASFLMDFVEDQARIRGYQAIRLDAFTQNPGALRLYTKRGYRMAGEVRFRKGTFYCFEKNIPSFP